MGDALEGVWKAARGGVGSRSASGACEPCGFDLEKGVLRKLADSFTSIGVL